MFPPLIGVGSAVRGEAVPLPYPMGSLDQRYDNDIDKWISKYELEEEYIVISDFATSAHISFYRQK